MSGKLAKLRDPQKELKEIVDDIAYGYHRIAKVAIDEVTDEEIREAARASKKEAPMFMHMAEKFVAARQGAALAEQKKAKLNLTIGGNLVVALPAPAPPPDAQDVVVLEVKEEEASDEE